MDTNNIKEHVDKINIEENVDETKRDFIKKFGKYAATAPLGLYLLMGPGASKAQASGSSVQVGTCYRVDNKIHQVMGNGINPVFENISTGKRLVKVDIESSGDSPFSHGTITISYNDNDYSSSIVTVWNKDNNEIFQTYTISELHNGYYHNPQYEFERTVADLLQQYGVEI